MPPLRRADLSPDPIAQFEQWFSLAREKAPLPEAMTLATVDADGAPDARMVLLKGADERGFRFYTNAKSAKGSQLSAAPHAALVIYWRELDRQVRVRGAVEQLTGAEADAYFRSRARDSQIGAWASPQSAALADRAALEARLGEVEERFAGVDVERPPHWLGYLVEPERIEFWQGQSGRLHDRFAYERAEEGWSLSRLGP